MVYSVDKALSVVIGRGGYNEMGLIRSCGEAGMEVVLVAPKDIVIPIYKSKYIKLWIDKDITNSQDLIETVEYIHNVFKQKRIVVFPASDLVSLLLDENYEKLSEYAIIPHSCGKLETLMDKANMAEIARKCSLMVPGSQRINLQNNYHPVIKYPCIVKPLRSVAGDKGDISICRNDAQFKEATQVYSSKKFYDMLVQDLVEGANQEEIAVTGVSTSDGKIYTEGVIHKKRIRGNGSTVFATLKDDAPNELQTKIRDFITETGFQGIFDIEFLKNDEGYHFIECNFRNGAYGYAVTRAGFNMPRYFAETNVNLPRPRIHKVTFMEERSDLLNVLDHTISPFQWLKDVIKTDVFLWWNWKDPKPMLRIPHFLKA